MLNSISLSSSSSSSINNSKSMRKLQPLNQSQEQSNKSLTNDKITLNTRTENGDDEDEQTITESSRPILQITDCRFESQPTMSLTDVWKQLNIDEINHSLQSPLSDTEIALSDPSKTIGFQAGEIIPQVPNFDMKFGSGIIEQSAEIIFLQFTNISSIDTTVHIRFPEDSEIVKENWMENADPTNEQRYQQAITDRTLFHVTPKKFAIAAGQAVKVTISYFHNFVGCFELPILVQIQNSKHLAFRLIAASAAEMFPTLSWYHFSTFSSQQIYKALSSPPTSSALTRSITSPYTAHSTHIRQIPLHHTFIAQPIGLTVQETPIQTFTLYNPTRYDVDFRVDCTQIQAVS